MLAPVPSLSRRSVGRLALLTLAVALGVLGCGDDGEGGESSGALGADGASAAAACAPVGRDLETRATKTVSMELQSFSFAPSTVQVAPGVVTFAARNTGDENHELAFLPGGGEVPLTADGKPDEEALETAGAFELEAFGPGRDCQASYQLEPGTYTLFCIVTSPDGVTHYDKGMRGGLLVV